MLSNVGHIFAVYAITKKHFLCKNFRRFALDRKIYKFTNYRIRTYDIILTRQVVELKPGGGDITVTRENSIEYLHLVAHYKLNVQLEKQFQAFRRGLSQVLPLHWLRLFSQNEFQVLISGAEMPINISDLKKNTAYSGGLLF